MVSFDMMCKSALCNKFELLQKFYRWEKPKPKPTLKSPRSPRIPLHPCLGERANGRKGRGNENVKHWAPTDTQFQHHEAALHFFGRPEGLTVG